jgi:hypothetical protein
MKEDMKKRVAQFTSRIHLDRVFLNIDSDIADALVLVLSNAAT